MKLAQALADAARARGHDPDRIAQWLAEVAGPLSGDVDADVARSLAWGPLEVAAALLPTLQAWLGDLAVGPVAPTEDNPQPRKPPSAGDVAKLANLYLDVRERGLADLGLRPPGRP